MNANLPAFERAAGGRAPAGDRPYYSISQAAALLGVSRVSIWRWIRSGRLAASRLGHRTTRIARADLEQILVAGESAGGRSWIGRTRTTAPERAGSERAPWLDWRDIGASEHIAQFYESDTFLLDGVAGFIRTALQAGDAAIVVATTAHVQGLDARLQASGLDLEALRARDQYLTLDAAGTLSRFMVDGMPDPARFANFIGGVIARAAVGGRRVRVFGEMVALLPAAGNHAAAIRLEELWNDLQQAHTFALFCAYPMDRLGGEAVAGLVRAVCTNHSRVIPAESYTTLPTPDDRLRAIAVLQHKARSLEAEIAERRKTEEQLRLALDAEQRAHEAAEAALRVRDDFLSIAAHELNTPITSLLGQAQIALRLIERDGAIKAEQAAGAMQVVARQARKLSHLVDRLLDISRLESGKLALERQPADLAVLVEQAVDAARMTSDRHAISLIAPRSLQAHVDPVRLEQVVTNLLDNAIKYSPDGGAIEVALLRRGRTAAELSVQDRGLGIPPDRRTQLFERYYQAHANGHQSGLGLGLAISREIVELHGGRIWADFPPEGGSRFTVRLPAGPAARSG